MAKKPTYEELEQRAKKLTNEFLERDQMEKEVERIFNFSMDMIGSGNLQGYFTKINSSFGETLGYSEKEILEHPFIKFVHDDDVEKTKKALADAAKGKKEIYIVNRYKCKNGSHKWIEWKVLSIVKENKFIAVGRDITERKRVGEKLQESNAKFEKVVESLPFDVFIIDRNNRYVLQNSICRKNWGDLIGKRPQDLPVNKETLNLWIKNNRRAFSGEIVTDEVEYHASKGKKCFYHNIIAPIRDKEGIHGILGILVDISDYKQIEESLKTSLKVKEILMSEIHHRVKNNFEIISSLIDLSSMNTEDRENKKLLSDIGSRIYSMALIHTQLYENNRFDQVDMKRHVHNILDYLSNIYGSNEKPINFVVDASEIYLSVNQAIPFSLALNEIITNSLKHAFKENKQGTISIFLNSPTEDTIFMTVKDDGVGISKEIDFDNTKRVGLNLAKDLIEKQLKGKIFINRDDGTEICVEFKKLKL